MDITLVLACALAFGAIAYQVTRDQLAESVLAKVDRLSLHPPINMPKLEWAILVYWTHNLHCESIPQTTMSINELRHLSRDLNEMLQSGPSRDSIDYLWDRYATLTDGGARYRAKYESIRDAIIEAAARDGDAYFDRRSYTDFVDSVSTRAE
ncbi:hypothetical protein SH528x_003408 [Novipirellula sp. SH528]|uniref:hypothetical protein n=1 Tax=Novipirellula sp. SH528 TaxID=3454466 RepID=UPI003FA0485C